MLCFSVVRMAQVFRVSRSGFYYWVKHRHKAIQREATRQEFDTKVKDAFDNSKGRDGSRRIQKELSENGDSHNVKTIAASMKRQDLTPKAARKFKCTTDSKHKMPVAPNLLAQDFNATAPNQKWAGDITYLATSEGWLYLAVIIDLYSRQVIGWSMDTRMTATLVCDALSMALFRRGFSQPIHAANILFGLDFYIFQAVTYSKNHIGDQCQPLPNQSGITTASIISNLLKISFHM
ncbi:transposase IS3 [Vibrio parahaemolyticus VP766]|nr:transposase IS3 [Vibrio parahaemolyticus VP766]